MRARQSWYGVKTVITVEEEEGIQVVNPISDIDPTETREIKSLDDARKAVFEVIMSVEGMEEETGFTPEDPNNPEILERLELLSMKKSLQKSVTKLPENLRQVIELRFYKCLTGNEVAEALNVTPSRISHMIREAVNKLRILMVAEGYNSL